MDERLADEAKRASCSNSSDRMMSSVLTSHPVGSRSLSASVDEYLLLWSDKMQLGERVLTWHDSNQIFGLSWDKAEYTAADVSKNQAANIWTINKYGFLIKGQMELTYWKSCSYFCEHFVTSVVYLLLWAIFSLYMCWTFWCNLHKMPDWRPHGTSAGEVF